MKIIKNCFWADKERERKKNYQTTEKEKGLSNFWVHVEKKLRFLLIGDMWAIIESK